MSHDVAERRERIAAAVLGGLVKAHDAYGALEYLSEYHKTLIKGAIAMADALIEELDECS